MEFDILDRDTYRFLDTDARAAITAQLPVCSVPVLDCGVFRSAKEILRLLGPSNYITGDHMEKLRTYATQNGLDPDRQCRETDPSCTMEGLYIKVEENGEVTQRVKFVRPSFYQCVNASGSHWQQRPIIPNQLKKR